MGRGQREEGVGQRAGRGNTAAGTSATRGIADDPFISNAPMAYPQLTRLNGRELPVQAAAGIGGSSSLVSSEPEVASARDGLASRRGRPRSCQSPSKRGRCLVGPPWPRNSRSTPQHRPTLTHPPRGCKIVHAFHGEATRVLPARPKTDAVTCGHWLGFRWPPLYYVHSRAGYSPGQYRRAAVRGSLTSGSPQQSISPRCMCLGRFGCMVTRIDTYRGSCHCELRSGI